MSLQVWLPLLGNLENHGVSDITVSNNGATVNANGKIGSCYYFNGSSQWLEYSKTVGDLYSGDFSYAIWLKPTDKTRGIIFSEYSSAGASNVAFELTASLQVRLYWNGSPDIYATNCTLTQDVWTHVAITRSGNVAKFYINGVLTYTYSGTLTNKTSTACIRMGDDYRGGTSVSYQGYMNDARLYNHCLSDKEVKEISRALVGHYKLNDRFNSYTEVVNGYGDLGTENWNNSSKISTTEVPSSIDSKIKASTSDVGSSELIPFDPNSNYYLSLYLKTTGATSGLTYPALISYDADKKEITHPMTAGLNSTYLTTLSQPLKKGDTVIHATDLSAWTTGDNHYYYVAIFGYVDDHGNLYPDMTYTRDVPQFGTKADKSHIDKTNNTITLNSAYTGADRPAGTAICQTCAGGVYYYPWGGITLSSIADWTEKTVTKQFGSDARMKYARYYKWFSWSGAWYAGVTVRNTKYYTTTVYDSSGYKYNGTCQRLASSTNSARYSLSTAFDGDTSSIQIPFNNMLGLTAAGKTQWSFCCWIYVSDFNTAKAWATIFGGPGGFEIETKNNNAQSGTYSAYSWGAVNVAYSLNAWHHIAAVDTTSETRWYLDGTRAFTGTSVNIPIGNYFIGSWQTMEKQNFKGRASDFRIYATALSDADIKELYEVASSVDDKGNMHTYELIEE